MSKRFFAAAFAAGLLTLAWVGLGFVGSSWMALAMTLLIGGAYLLGAFELTQFRAATATLARALADMPQPLPNLGDWLGSVSPALRGAVRSRIEGERGGLPGPALTPYLVGLLVMLGMLGTFLGMVLTFKGAVFALEGSTDLQAIRSALAAPIKGLGLSFGTSVAGVATSAMLGLMSAISRRERLDVARELDSRVATVLLPFSLVHQRQETFKALQGQARALPEVVDRLDAMMERMEQRSRQLDEELLARQAQFQRDAALAYTELAHDVGAALKESLAASGRAAGESISPVVESAMSRIVAQSERLHQRLGDAANSQVDALSQQFGATARTVSDAWALALKDHARTSDALVGGLQRALGSFTGTFEQRSAALAVSVEGHLARTQSDQALAEQQRLRAWTQALQGMAAELQGEWRRAGDEAVKRQQEISSALEKATGEVAAQAGEQAARTARLLDESAEMVRSRTETEARWTERDNLALQERSVLLEQLGTLLHTVNQASGEQRAAIEAMVASASTVMEQAGARFADALDAHAGKAGDMAAHITGSAVELSSLGEAFSHSVQLFQASSDKLTDSLQRIDASLQRSTARSDEQLAYYVAQAREVIDLSIASQHGLVENLRHLQAGPGKAAALADGARA